MSLSRRHNKLANAACGNISQPTSLYLFIEDGKEVPIQICQKLVDESGPAKLNYVLHEQQAMEAYSHL
jgi:hypothetical protein